MSFRNPVIISSTAENAISALNFIRDIEKNEKQEVTFVFKEEKKRDVLFNDFSEKIKSTLNEQRSDKLKYHFINVQHDDFHHEYFSHLIKRYHFNSVACEFTHFHPVKHFFHNTLADYVYDHMPYHLFMFPGNFNEYKSNTDNDVLIYEIMEQKKQYKKSEITGYFSKPNTNFIDYRTYLGNGKEESEIESLIKNKNVSYFATSICEKISPHHNFFDLVYKFNKPALVIKKQYFMQ